MKTSKLPINILIFITSILILSSQSSAGMSSSEKKERDPYLDEFQKRVTNEVKRMRVEMQGYKISHADIDCQIKVDERFFSSITTLTMTIPSGKKNIPLLIFEDFEIHNINLITSKSMPPSSTSDISGGKTISAAYAKTYNNLKFTRTIPYLNKEADEYRAKKGIKFEDLHFNDGQKIPRLPHIIWVKLPSNIPELTTINLELTYSGTLNRMDQHPFTNQQVFLNGNDCWIPSLLTEKPTTSIKVKIDRPWHAFCQGKLLSEKITDKTAEYNYASSIPQPEPVIIAGDYRVEKEKFRGIDLYGFYLTEDEGGKKVMEKSKEYIDFFSNLIGQYPFESFAIIESPAPVGYGYPSFTAIGTLVMRMHFTEPFALGHEILHNWWGNHVEIPPDRGNWCEALTTYMANYHYVEATQGALEALHERQRNLETLSIYLGGKDEFPLKDFEYNKGNIHQVVGYTKGFFLLHETRRLIGDEAFFKALRNFYSKYGGKEATWDNLRDEFKLVSDITAEKLDKLYHNFLNELGIPKINIEGVVLHKDIINSNAKYSITGNVSVEGKFLPICEFPYVIKFADRDKLEGKIDLLDKNTSFELKLDKMPLSIEFDPDYDVCRFIPEIDRALNLNRFYDRLPACVLIPKDDTLYRELADSIKIMDERPTVKKFSDYEGADDMDLLIFATSDDLSALSTFLSQNRFRLPFGFELKNDEIIADGKKYKDNSALLITIGKPEERERTVSILYSLSADELKKARGRLRFYGDFGWVLFNDVKAIAKGNFPLQNSSLTVKFEFMITCKDGMCFTEEMPL